MDKIKIVYAFFIVLALVSIQYTLNKILMEIKKLNSKLDHLTYREPGYGETNTSDRR